jgi:hypothetical protein
VVVVVQKALQQVLTAVLVAEVRDITLLVLVVLLLVLTQTQVAMDNLVLLITLAAVAVVLHQLAAMELETTPAAMAAMDTH